jgi:peptidyl-Asp metalloendopeptidase
MSKLAFFSEVNRTILCLLLLAGWLLPSHEAAAPVSAQGAVPLPLFKDAPTPKENALAADPNLLRVRYVYADTAALQPALVDLQASPTAMPVLDLPLFADAHFTARLKKLEISLSGGKIFSGDLQGVADSAVVLSVQDNVLVGSVSLPGTSYQVGYNGSGVDYIVQINPGGVPEGPDSPLPPGRPPVSAQADNGDDDGSYIDIMVVYTQRALTWAGGEAAMNAHIAAWISETNTGYVDSQVNQRVRLVHSEMVSYNENAAGTGDYYYMPKTLDHLTYKIDGYMDNVHAMRDTYAADMVVLLVGPVGGSIAGVGWLMGQSWVRHDFEPYAFSVVAAAYAYNLVLPHEMGHNMGADHDRDHSSGGGAFPYSYGYCLPGTTYHTIMAYDSSSCIHRINRWSNPDVNYSGVPTGVIYSEDNAQTLDNTAPTVAQFRDGPPANAAPTNLSAAANSRTQVTFNWTNNSLVASSVSLERAALAGGVWGSFAEFKTVAGDATSYVDNSMHCGTSYRFRLSAFFTGDGYTTYSNTAEATTAPCYPDAPADLTANASTSLLYQVNLSWDDNSDNETGFRIERNDGGDWTSPGSVGTDVNTFSDPSSVCGSDYQYRVWAYNDHGDSLMPSNTAPVSTRVCPPDGLTLTPRSQIRINLGWNDTSHNEDGFRIERSLDTTPRSWTTWDVGANTTGYSDDALVCNTTYVYRVWATGNGEVSVSPSGELSAATLACGSPPMPVDATASPRTPTSIRISWTDIDGETSYEVERWNGTGWDVVAASLLENSSTFVNTGLANDTVYTYRIRSHNSYGYSAYAGIPPARTYKLALYMPFVLKK